MKIETNTLSPALRSFFLIILFSLSWATTSFATFPPKSGPKKKTKSPFDPNVGLGNNYWEFGGGYGLWYQSNQLHMENSLGPRELFVEYGKMNFPVSIAAGYNFNTQFTQEGFLLSPDYKYLRVNFNFSHFMGEELSKDLKLYAFGGMNLWNADLQDTRDPIAGSEANLIEKDNGAGVLAGAGIRYYFGPVGIGAQYNYFGGKGEYFAGTDDKLSTWTGSSQLLATLSFRITTSGKKNNKILCPTYR
ncbi:hypothetical protein [Flexithrix dorotheae]|uniref:hypothetical protein n=1 Tax=Flexithrix dorotheae TaxID=70993 RepID=UPI00036104F0|nr:hypothetical protein [Flexithrix dorotheae]